MRDKRDVYNPKETWKRDLEKNRDLEKRAIDSSLISLPVCEVTEIMRDKRDVYNPKET